jgi:predicted nucleic acid-binding protein
MKLIVADAGPLIALSRIGKLHVLSSLFTSVLVPSSVLEELRLHENRPGVEQLALAYAKQKWFRSVSPPDLRPIQGLDKGECAAIHLAEHLKCPLLVDERRGRTAARRRHLDVIGTGRILLAAKQKGLIEGVGVVLDELRSSGYRLSGELCSHLRKLAGE